MNSSKIVILLLLLRDSYGFRNSSSYSAVHFKNSLPKMASLTAFDAKSLVQCSVACQLREACQSFAFHGGNSDCLLYSQRTTSEFSTEYGYAYYTADQTTAVVTASSPYATTTTTATTVAGQRNVRFEVYTSSSLTIIQAKQKCKTKFNGQLACIHSQEDQQALNQVIGGSSGCDYFWIGLEKVDGDSYLFKWIDGIGFDSRSTTPKYYKNWDTFYPTTLYSTNPGIAVMVTRNGKWREDTKNSMYCSVCEIPV